MDNTDYTIHGIRGAAQELRDISETDIKKATIGISGGGAEFALHFRGGAAPGFFKRLTTLENSIGEINRNLTELADDIEQAADNKRRVTDSNQNEMGN